MWEDPPGSEEGSFQPCPAPWFSEFSALKTAADVLNCAVPEVNKFPASWRGRALAYSRVMEKAKPGLEAIAEQRAKNKQTARTMLDKNRKGA